MALAKNAAAFTIMADGIPIIYAGQEQHFSGAKDPNNREALWPSGYNTDSKLYKLIAKANAIRNLAIRQNKDYITNKVSHARSSAFERIKSDKVRTAPSTRMKTRSPCARDQMARRQSPLSRTKVRTGTSTRSRWQTRASRAVIPSRRS